MVALVTGAQFATALIGMTTAVAAGLLYLLSLRFMQTPALSASVLLSNEC